MEITWLELLVIVTAVVSYVGIVRLAHLIGIAYERIDAVWKVLASHDEQFAELYLKNGKEKDVSATTTNL